MSKISLDALPSVIFELSGRPRRILGNNLQPAFRTILQLRIVARRVGAIVRILTLGALGGAIHVALNVSAGSRLGIDRLIRIRIRVRGVIRIARVVRISGVVRISRVIRVAPTRTPIKSREADANTDARSAVPATVTAMPPATAVPTAPAVPTPTVPAPAVVS